MQQIRRAGLGNKMMKKTILAWLVGAMIFSASPAKADEAAIDRLTVSKAVTHALANNPIIREADERIHAAIASVKSSRADLLPEASLNYSYQRQRDAPIMMFNGNVIQTAHRRLYNWNVTVIQPLFSGFALASKLNISKLDVTARQLEKEQTVLDLIRDVKSACYRLLLSNRLLKVSNQEIDALSAHQRNAELFFREGLVRPNDVLQAQVALANSIQQREKAVAEVKKAEARVNRLLNRPLDESIQLMDIASFSKSMSLLNGKALSQEALTNRPLIKLLDISLEQLRQSLRIAKSEWYPTISLLGQYEQSGDNPGATQNDYTNDHNTSIGFQAQWKFFQSGKTRAETDRVRRQIKALDAGIIRYQNQIREEVRNAILDCHTAHKNIGTARAALHQAVENWRITVLQYKQQVSTATDVLDARAFLTQAESNYFLANYDYLDAVAGLNRAIGKKRVN
ncbi:transporter [Desulfosarcina ovata subsp. sediminis]|uniref:Transporter n=1 Tax=Desulfosarcina ovata subsp. sediminis TaxID=885957 RepID=A0A5K7ZQK8_9BACT|nr:TolC family protein [Desulfosarcina ovata]BBO82689.1 transporter [Desulfosarcina ovata subsp. sediminis]